MTCTGRVPRLPETCNGKDDDCNGLVDDSPTDVGADCGSSVGECKKGKTVCQQGSIVCTGGTDPKSETCNGKDDDCNGAVDDNAQGVGQPCGQSATAPCRMGSTQCVGGVLTCSGNIDPQPETCDGVDNNCNGIVDDSVAGAGQPCGASNVYPCAYGTKRCQNGQLVCTGSIDPIPEVCNGIDDDCDGVIDATGSQPPADSVGACNVPPTPPGNATTPCAAGQKKCQGGTVVCLGSTPGSTLPLPGVVDTCNVNANCDGQLTNQPNLLTDVYNCGACGNDCYSGTLNELWTCDTGMCKFTGCTPGFYDLDSNHKDCEYQCTFVSLQESCNGKDDNCDGKIDENVDATAPNKAQTCGISPSATRPECTTQVSLTCQGKDGWKCTFPQYVCPGGCSPDDEICDAYDNDCDGQLNENVSNYGKPCASDDGKPPPGDGACRTTGTYDCNGPTATKCNATKADCKSLPGGCTELCDGIDNDCDGAVDETAYEEHLDNTFVRPAVVQVAASLWMFQYEASRTNATASAAGTGDGYFCTANCTDGSGNAIPVAPTGATLDKTRACSLPSRLPWFNVTPIESEQVCGALGGHVCTVADWQTACHVATTCTWGYAPSGSCKTGFTANTYCNLGVSV